MTPNPRRRSVILGLFVTAATAILAAGVLTIGNLNDAFTDSVSATAVFAQVNGLKKGDNVWFSGLKVGTVKRLGFADAASVEVELRIDEDAAHHIRQDVKATIGADGLIGNRIVVLVGGTPGAPELSDGARLEIGEAVSTDQIMAVLQTNNENLAAITADLRGVTGALSRGEGSLGMLLSDDGLYVSASQTAQTLSGVATSLTGTASSLRAAADHGRALTGSLSAMTPSLKVTVDGLQGTGARADALVADLAKSAADPGTPLGTLVHDGEAGADLKVTLDNLSESSALLTQDLESLKHSFLLRGAIRRQERAAAKREARGASTP